MSAIILTDENLNILKKERVIDESVDVSFRHSPKAKVEKYRNESIVFRDFYSFASWILSYLGNCIAVCFGKDDFVALNDQLKIHNLNPVTGDYYDLNVLMESNLGKVSELLNVKHDRHDPLSDSEVTLELFKYLKINYNIEDAVRPIPNKNTVLDIVANGTIKENSK